MAQIVIDGLVIHAVQDRSAVTSYVMTRTKATTMSEMKHELEVLHGVFRYMCERPWRTTRR